MSKLSHDQFKQLVTNRIPADRIASVEEFHLGGNRKATVIYLYNSMPGFVKVEYTRDNGVDIQVNMVNMEYVYRYRLTHEQAAQMGQALVDAAWIAEEVERRNG